MATFRWYPVATTSDSPPPSWYEPDEEPESDSPALLYCDYCGRPVLDTPPPWLLVCNCPPDE